MEKTNLINIPIKLDVATQKQLEALDVAFKQAEKALDGLEAAGLEIPALREQLNTTKEQRKMLLKHFGQ